MCDAERARTPLDGGVLPSKARKAVGVSTIAISQTQIDNPAGLLFGLGR
jgi:hypothetical protein